MTDNMKKTFRLIKYGHEVKGYLLLSMVFLLFGIFVKIMGIMPVGFDIIFLLMPPIFLCQILYGLDYVKMVSSSALKRCITVHMADLLVDVTVFLVLILYYVVTELRNNYPGEFLVAGFDGYYVHSTGYMMFFAGVVVFILMCYMAGCYKCYWAATIIFCLLMMVYGGFSVFIMDYFQDKDISNEGGFLAAVLFYLAGVLVSGGIRRLLYKVPVSSLAVGKRLGKLS